MERTRHLQIWHDHSTLANHGHILFMVSCLYDPAVHLTNLEYKLETGEEIDVQMEVEKPEIYIVGRCRSSDTEQLAYVESRLCCLQHLQRNLPTEKEGCMVEINDNMRFFHVTRQPRTLKVVSRREVIIIALDMVFMHCKFKRSVSALKCRFDPSSGHFVNLVCIDPNKNPFCPTKN